MTSCGIILILFLFFQIRHEENIREFLTQTSEKEAEARTKLEAFMDRLLMRAEKAEKEAEVHCYNIPVCFLFSILSAIFLERDRHFFIMKMHVS